MVEENSKCPVCGDGSMKLILDTAELTPQAIKTSLRAENSPLLWASAGITSDEYTEEA